MNVRAAWVRLLVTALVAGTVGVALEPVAGPWQAPVVGWIVLAVGFSAWTWVGVAPMDAQRTREFATREDPSHLASTIILVMASMASLGGVAALLSAGATKSGAIPQEALLGVAAVASSWVLVHLLFALHYARLYYADPESKPIDFNSDAQPDYHDFAYLAFTLGMTYQVSDTALNAKAVRRTALRHSLLSYLLGAVVLACTINLVVQLASAR